MTTAPARRNAWLDLLRGAAIALVIVRHAAPSAFPGAGVVGVVMFFTLSGYLITGVLLAEHGRTGTVALGRFYVRRARRLVPALLVLLLGYLVVTWCWDPLGQRGRIPASLAVALTWTANLPGRPSIDDGLFHLWTLAGEEQFYLLWPTLVLLGLKRGMLRTVLWSTLGVAVVACLASTWWLAEAPDNAYVLPTSWALCFVIGGLARAAAERRSPAWQPVTRGPVVLAAAVLAGLSLLQVRGHVSTYLVVGPVVAAATAVLLLATRTSSPVPGMVRPLVHLGVVSYGAYLWNYPLTLWLRPLGWWGPWVAVLLTLAAALASWVCIERPVQRWFERRDAVRSRGATVPTPTVAIGPRAREKLDPC